MMSSIMRYIRDATMLMILMIVALPGTAWACRCVPAGDDVHQQVEHALEAMDMVFSGKAIALRVTDDRQIEATFAVNACWKGACDAPHTTLYTAESTATCGYRFMIADEYMVFASTIQDRLRVHSCTLTQPLHHADEVVRLLGAPLATPQDDVQP